MTETTEAAPTSQKPVLVLDLDGTLVDTATDLVVALNVAIASVGMSGLTTEEVGTTAGKGGRAMIALAYKTNNRTLDDKTMDTLIPIFLDHYRRNIAVHSRPYPGAIEAIKAVQDRGWLAAVCTNKLESLAKLLLDELEIDPLFSAICGSDTFQFRKPDGRHILETIAICNGDQSRSVMVGDTATDINAALDAGISSIAVDFVGNNDFASNLGADRTISHYKELWPVLQALENR